MNEGETFEYCDLVGMWYDGEKASDIVLYYLRKNLLPPLKKNLFLKEKKAQNWTLASAQFIFC